jgi:hypothetical protein
MLDKEEEEEEGKERRMLELEGGGEMELLSAQIMRFTVHHPSPQVSFWGAVIRGIFSQISPPSFSLWTNIYMDAG